ncbi:MAG TPA: DUF6491 family protein [Steroidobacteraceae bacterium]|nr:DUF6491 family protein [Steroidobacteraceae bacterium]
MTQVNHGRGRALVRWQEEIMCNRMIRYAARLLIVLGALVAAACATTGAASHPAAAPLPGTDACVFMSEVSDWVVVDPATLIVYAPLHKDPYLLKLFEPVPELNFKERVGFEDSDHNGMLCGYGDYLVVRDEVAPWRVPIVAFRKLTPEQAKQLLPAAKTQAGQPANSQPPPSAPQSGNN